MALGLPLEVCLHVYDDILCLSGTTLEKLMKQWLKSYYLFMIYIDCCVLGEKLAYLRTLAKKFGLTQNYERNVYSVIATANNIFVVANP